MHIESQKSLFDEVSFIPPIFPGFQSRSHVSVRGAFLYHRTFILFGPLGNRGGLPWSHEQQGSVFTPVKVMLCEKNHLASLRLQQGLHSRNANKVLKYQLLFICRVALSPCELTDCDVKFLLSVFFLITLGNFRFIQCLLWVYLSLTKGYKLYFNLGDHLRSTSKCKILGILQQYPVWIKASRNNVMFECFFWSLASLQLE